MAAKKTEDPKIILEREYIIPLRRTWLKVPEYKRGKKAVKAIKLFLVRHMKVYDRDIRKIKIDVTLNNELRFRGIRSPPAKIKIKAKKFDNELVTVELTEVPEFVKFRQAKLEKSKVKINSAPEKVKKEEKKIESVETKEKEEAAKEENLKLAKEQAREKKHVSKVEEERIQRKALAK
ncbi:60S ribosomal protein L31 [Candidatus Pacearchaeota archaeon]|nr:60S ribosomal protein L31 [Candidatus Pacearchaeota archaeon]